MPSKGLIFTRGYRAEANATTALEKEQSYCKIFFGTTKKPTIDEIAQYWNLNEEETEKFKKAKKGAYNPLQTKLKVMIGDGTGLETILITLKHYTGALIVTGNENVAWYHHVVLFLK